MDFLSVSMTPWTTVISVSQCAFLQDLFHFLCHFTFFSHFPELFKNVSAGVDLQIRKI